MRIGLNGTPYDALSSGARDRFLRLYGAAARLAPEDEFVVYSPRDVALGPLLEGPVAKDVRSPFGPDRPLARFIRSRRWFERRAVKDRLDAFVTDHFPVLSTVPTVLTIHDLRFLVLPGEGSRARRLYFRLRYAAVARRAAVVVTVSETIRREVVELLRVPPGRVRVVPNGVGPEFRPAGGEAVRRIRVARALPPGYLLHLGVLEPRKNLRTLLGALAHPAAAALPPLVLVGRGGSEEGVLRSLARTLGIADRVIFAGYVAEEELPALLTGATALALPSRYEGFGLPVLQAFACGTPVVAARAGALPEVAGDAALLVDPDDAAELAAALVAAMDPVARDRLVAKGRTRAAAFAWEEAARVFLRTCPGGGRAGGRPARSPGA